MKELRHDPCECGACAEIRDLRELLEEAAEAISPDYMASDIYDRIRQALHREEGEV